MLSNVFLPNKARILTHHGIYKSVYKMSQGDAVMYRTDDSLKCNIAYVEKATHVILPIKSVEMNTDLWHSNMYFLSNNKLCTNTGICPARDLTLATSIIAPMGISDPHHDNEAAYESGYILGTIMFAGFVHNKDVCNIYFDDKESLKTFYRYWTHNYSGFHVKISKPASVFKVKIEAESLFSLLYKTPNDVSLMESLVIKSPNFAKGIIDAYSNNLTHNISREIYEIYLWAKMLLSEHIHTIKSISQDHAESATVLSLLFPTTSDEDAKYLYVNNCMVYIV